MGKKRKQCQTLFLGDPKSLQMLTAAMKLKDACLDSILKNRDITFPTKVCLVKAIFPVVMYGCESWTIKKAKCQRIDAFELWCWWRLQSPCTEIKSINPKENQAQIFIGRTVVEAEAPVLWSPDAKSWLTGIDIDAGKDWRQKKKGVTVDEMVRWHLCFNEPEFEQTPGDSKGQRSLACCSL